VQVKKCWNGGSKILRVASWEMSVWTTLAFSIGKALSQGFGKALSEIFSGAKELKRGYEFLPTARRTLAR
jgi:hypothetical protein